nr:MAG TPA: hypothetical protein [Caudoviricetes sp.]
MSYTFFRQQKGLPPPLRQAGGIKGGVKRRKNSDWEISERQEINRAALLIQAKSRASRPGEGLSDSPRRWSAFRFERNAQSEPDAACAPNEKRLPAAHLAAPPNLMQHHAALSSCLNPK